MAYTTTITCADCRKNKQTIVSAGVPTPTICPECQSVRRAEKRAAYFAELDNMTLEERIRRIEEWIYEYKPVHVPAPRF